MPQVSIVLPTYNRVFFLKEAIASVLQQTYTDFELLIVDDGSTDATEAMVAQIRDERIRYIRLEHSGRISAVRNTGIRNSNGCLIAFLDSDDLWKETKLEQQAALFEDYPETGFSVTDVTTVRGDEVLIPHTFYSPERIVRTHLFPHLAGNRFIVYGSVLMVRKSCFEQTGMYNESLRDGDLLLNMLLAYHFPAAIIYDPLTIRRIHDSNISERLPIEYYGEYLFTFTWLYRQQMISRRRWKQAKSLAHMKMGQIYRARGETKVSAYHFINALRNNLFYPRHVLLLLKTILRTQPAPSAREQ
jgi:glycosyltransferase involved in cell wall biosynthesis